MSQDRLCNIQRPLSLPSILTTSREEEEEDFQQFYQPLLDFDCFSAATDSIASLSAEEKSKQMARWKRSKSLMTSTTLMVQFT